jgi:proteasome lid subunit RPN8/RPN11
MREPEVVDELINHMLEQAPREACGFIVPIDYRKDDLRILRVENVSKEPNVTFKMDPAHSRRIQTCEHVIAVWHSHPHGPNKPSEPDRVWKPPNDWQYLLVTIEGVSEWRDTLDGWELIRIWPRD